MMTIAWASGPSSVSDTSITASWPAGVIAFSRSSAPPVSFMVGRPDGRLITPMSRKNTPLRKPVPIDPWGRPYVFLYPGQANPNGYDLISYGADGKPGGENEDADILSWK